MVAFFKIIQSLAKAHIQIITKMSYKLWLIVLFPAILLLSGCSGDNCIDADDFGFIKIAISSRYDKEEISEAHSAYQVTPWRDSGFIVNGKPLTIIVKTWINGIEANSSGELSAWGPWYGTSDNKTTLSDFCARLQECSFLNNLMCTPTKDAKIINAPCIFKNGVGLYALIPTPGTDPNLSFASQRSPDGLTFHLGEKITNYNLYDIGHNGDLRPAGGIVYNYQENANDATTYANSPLYFKILDKFYDDNNGQYKVVIKSGIVDYASDPISILTSLVIKNLFGTDDHDHGLIRNIYQKITANSDYRMAVAAMLSLYVIFTTYSFIIGNIQLTNAEFIKRIVKIIFVSILLNSTYSWSFFNDYIFVYFVEGLQEILQIIQSTSTTGPGSSSILALMIAPQTMAKLFSLLFVDWLGFIYIILFLFVLYFISFMILEATILYLTALIATGMIITMAPIFICFLLFDITRSLFENWFKQLISYALQPIILFTGIALISVIIRTEIYSSLGFKVCKQDFPNLGAKSELFTAVTNYLDPSIQRSIFYWYFPNPMKGENFSKIRTNIPTPEAHTQDDGTICAPYECNENRYVELPFLNPNKPSDITKINNFFAGNFIQFSGLLLIFISVYLLSKFNDASISISRFLSSTVMNATTIDSVTNNAFMPIKSGFHSLLSKAQSFMSAKIGSEVNKMISRSRGQSNNKEISAIKEPTKDIESDINMKAMPNISASQTITTDSQTIETQNNYVENIDHKALNARLETGEWQGIHIDDPRMRTYHESLQDQQRYSQHILLKSEINKISKDVGYDILNPEYLAKLQLYNDAMPIVTRYESIARKNLENVVYNALSEGAEPVLMGEKFMLENASDEQSRNMIDRAYKIQDTLIQNDPYIQMERDQENLYEKAMGNIVQTQELLKEYNKYDHIKYEELEPLLNEYYNKQTGISAIESKEKVYNLKASSQEVAYRQLVLQHIEKRKSHIVEHVNSYVDQINQQRDKTKMSRYAKQNILNMREFKTIENHLHNKHE